MDALSLLDKYGFSTAAACAGFWFIVKLVNYVLNDLKGSTESLEAITIKLIDKENEQNKTICELERTLKNYLSPDCKLQLAYMKLESLVIVDQNATVNMYLSLVHTARHITEIRFI